MAVTSRRIPATLSWRTVRQAGYRLSWGIADQGMSTLTNFLLSIFVVRTLGAAQFGAFSLAYVTYGFADNASRGLSIEPLLIRFSGTDLRTWRRATAACTGTALVVGLVTGGCAVGAGALIGGTTGLAFLALGLTLPGLMLQDSWRYAFFALGRGHHAFVNDTVWALVQVPLLVFLKINGHANVFWFVFAWGMAAAAGAVVGMLQARVVPSLPGAVKWLVRHRDLGPRYLAENTGGNATDSVRSYSASYILGLSAVGHIQAASVLMGPFKVIFYGLGMVTIPEASRLLRHSPRRLPQFCAAVSIGLTLLVLAWGAVLLVALPRGLGHLVLGSTWRPAYPLVAPTALAMTAMCATTGAAIGMHALGAARRSLRATILTSVLITGAAILGAETAGALGMVSFAAAASVTGGLASWWQLRQALLEHHATGVPNWLWPPAKGKHRSPSGRYRIARRERQGRDPGLD